MAERSSKETIQTFFGAVLSEAAAARGADLDDFIGRDYVEHAALPGQASGVEGVRGRLEQFAQGFPDFAFALDDIVAEGHMVAVRWTMTGTNTGPFLGAPASGRRVSVTGMDFYRVVGGKIREHWHEMDVAGLMDQLAGGPERKG
jgi:steroid delta-isomerase-like uncharacterized protein